MTSPPLQKLLNIHFVQVGKGRLALFHRPKTTDFAALREAGCTHIVTLLKESEGAERYGVLTKDAHMDWVWLPVPNGKYPEPDVHHLLLQAMPKLSQLLDGGRSVLIHCSAGVHRTGMVAYGLLRWRGVSREQAINLIRTMRPETADGMMEKRMRWGDDIAPSAPPQDTQWLPFAREFVRQLKMKLFRSR